MSNLPILDLIQPTSKTQAFILFNVGARNEMTAVRRANLVQPSADEVVWSGVHRGKLRALVEETLLENCIAEMRFEWTCILIAVIDL